MITLLKSAQLSALDRKKYSTAFLSRLPLDFPSILCNFKQKYQNVQEKIHKLTVYLE